jgi:precorrin-2 dehydrogenase/sirohydrochlorin ferrochelatase
MAHVKKYPQKYPIFLDLAGKECLVVGAGSVAERKMETLVDAGASVKVVAPEATAGIGEAAKAGRIRWEKRVFEPADLDGAVLAIAATEKEDVNVRVRDAAVRRGVLVNVVDRPELCDFFVPAVVSRGQLQVAVSTGGASPALARRLREQLEEMFGPEYGEYLELVGDFRRRVRRRVGDARSRELAYDRLFDSNALDRIRRGENIDVESLVTEYV